LSSTERQELTATDHRRGRNEARSEQCAPGVLGKAGRTGSSRAVFRGARNYWALIQSFDPVTLTATSLAERLHFGLGIQHGAASLEGLADGPLAAPALYHIFP
jgi:hypothetical protein